MVNLGIVRGQEIQENRDGGETVRLLQVEMTNATDIQTVQYMPMAGDDSPPQNGDRVVVQGIGTAFQVAIGVQDSVTPSADAGERKLYSRDSNGAVAAHVTLTPTGDIELNGNADTAVLFAALNGQLQALVADINTVLGGKLDGSGTPGTLNLDISAAESPTVKLT